MKLSPLSVRLNSLAPVWFVCAALLTGVVLPVHRAEGIDYYWNTATGTWQIGGNWSDTATTGGTTGVVPSSSDSVFFNQSTVNGSQTIDLNAATGILGMTFNNTGTTTLQSDSVTSRVLTLGPGGITVAGTAGAVTIGNATNGTSVTLGGTQTWTNNGTLTLVNGLALGANPLIFSGTGTTNLNGVISGSVATGTVALTINTGSTVNIGSTANTFTGDITINGGTLSSSMAGGAATSPLGNQIGAVYRTLNFTNGGTYVSNVNWNDNVPSATNVGVRFNFGTGGGTLQVNSGTTLTLDDGTGNGTASTNSQLQGTGNLTKTGLGVLSLGNAATSNVVFTGQILVNNGVLRLGSMTAAGVALGATSANTVIASGAAFDINNSAATSAEPLTISGVGAGTSANYNTAAGNGTNAIYSSNAAAGSFAGPITLAAASTIGAGAAGTMTLSGGVTGAFDLTINNLNAGGTTLSTQPVNNGGTITNSGAGAGLTTISSVIGTNVTGVTQNSATSQLTLSNAANTFTSAITVSNGQFNANSVTGFGSATATTNVNLGNASTVGTAVYGGGAAGTTRKFVVGGAAGGQLLNNGTGLLTLTAAAPILNLSAGPLTIGGSNSITLTPAALAVPVTGGNTLTKIGAGTVTLGTSGAGTSATISGATPIIITAGTLQQTSTQTALAANSLGTGLIKFNPVNAGTATLGMSFASVTNTYSNTINVDAPATGTSTSIISVSAGATFSGPIVLGTGVGTGIPTLRFTNTNGALFTVTATGGITGTGNISLNGTGATAPITLSGTNPINITGSITNIGTNGAAASVATISAPITTTNLTAISQQGASPFTISSSLALTSALNSFTSTGAGLWTFNNTNTFTGAQNLTFNANSTGGITVSGTNLNHTGTVTNSGTNLGTTTISSALGASVGNVIQNSATSALVLSGANSAYTGTYTVSNGRMQFSSTGAMTGFTGTPNANVKLSVASGGILGLAYPTFTEANVTDLVTNANGGTYSNVMFAATGASIGLDTSAGSTSFASFLANPTGSALGLVKLGANTLTLGTANTYTGPTWVQNGTLSAGTLNSVTTPAPVGASSLGTPTSSANGTISLGFGTTTGTLSYTGGAATTDRVINLAGTTGGGGIDNSGTGTLVFSSPMTFTGTGAKTLTVSGASNTTFGAAVAGGGVGSASPLTISKTGNGTLLLNATGPVNTNSATTLTIAGGIVDIGASGLTVSNSGATVIQTTANTTINATGGGTLTISSSAGTNAGDIRPALGTTLTINANISTPVTNTGFWTAQGGGLELNDAGTLVLNGNNTIAGVTSFTGAGTISVGNIATNLNGTTGLLFSIAGSRFLYTGNGETTAVPLQPGANSTVEQAGLSGTLNFSANWATGAAVKTVTLQGSTAGLGVISGIISNNSVTNTTAITKAGTGTWTLSGANTYTGATTVNGGNLILSQGSGSGVLGNTGIVINSGGTLSPIAGFTVGNTATAAAGGRLTLNTGGVLNLADGTIGNLNLVQNSTFGGNAATFAGGSIVFDISASAADQIDVRLNNLAGTGLATSSGGNAISFNPIAGTLGTGSYTLINAGGTLNDSNFFLASPNLVVGGTLYNLSLGLVGTNEVLTVATGGAAATPGVAFWKGTTNASWALGSAGGVATNWVASATGSTDTWAVPGSTTNLTLTANTIGVGGLSTTLDQAFTINSLTLSGTGTANTAGSTIASGTGGPASTLTINAAALTGNTLGNGITVLAGSGANTISAPVILGGNQTWTNNSTNALTVGGGISGTATLATAGTGSIVLSGASTYIGTTTIGTGSTLRLDGTAGSLGTGDVINSGSLQMNRSNAYALGNNISGAGTFTHLGTGTTTLSGTNTYTGNTNVAAGTLNLPTGGSLTGNGTATTGSILNVGTVAGQNAVVNVSGGNINSYYSFGLGTAANSVGVLNMSGGSYTGTSTKTDNTINFVGQAGYGYLNITGGTFTAKGRFAPSNGVGTTGVMYIGGTGTFDHTAGEWFLMAYSASGNGGLSQVTVGPGGTLNRVGASQTFGLNMDRANGYAVLSIAGGQMDNGVRAIAFGNANNTINTTGILNLAAGTLTVGAAMSNNPGTGTGNTGYLNFAGGTLRTSAAVTAIIPASSAGQSITSRIYGAIDNSTVSGAPSFVGGLTVDTNSFNSTLTNALLAPVGTGVRQADLTLNGGAGYVGAPAVQFSKPASGGSPASGYALISGGQVTGIVITSPGDYASGETPTVSLTGGGATSAATVTVAALNTAATSGGLTKTGLGTLTLTGASTYTGKTIVSGGGGLSFNTIGNVGAANSALGAPTTIANGTIDLDGTLTYTGAVASTDRVINLTNAATGSTVNNSGSGLLTLNGDITGNATNLLFRGAGSITMNGLIGATHTGNVSHTDGSTLTLTNASNAWTGNLLVSSGIVSANTISNKNVASAIGAGTLITLGQDGFNNTGTFQYTGLSGGSSDRDISILSNTGNTNGGIIENTVAGQLLTLSGAITTGGSGLAPSLQLTGAGNGLLSGGITGSPALAITKSGTGLWTLSGTNTSTGAITISNGTLRFAGSTSLNSSTPIGMANGATLQVRDDTAGTISHTTNNITASGSGTVTIDVGNNGGATIGSTVAFGALNSGTAANALGVVYNFTGANGYLQSYSSVALPGTTGNNTTFNPTTSSIVVTGNVTNQMAGFANTNFDTLFLGGTSAGNAINGVISDAATASPTANGLTLITKQGTSTWTLGGVSTYRGATTVNGGTLRLAAGSGLANTAITVNPAAAGANPTFAVTPGSGTINIGNTGDTTRGATLTLNPGSAANPFASAFTMQDNAVGVVNLTQGATFSGNALTLGGASALGYVLPSLNFDIGGTSLTDIDVFNVTKLANVGTGGVLFNFAALTGATSLTAGNYTFLNASGGLSAGGTLYTLGTSVLSVGANNYSLSLGSSTTTQGILSVSLLASNVAPFWKGDIDGSWNSFPGGTDTNFATSLTGTADTVSLPDLNSNVTFTTAVASNLSTTLDANFTINSLTFNGTGTSNAAGSTIASGTGSNTLTINAAALNGNILGNGISVGTGSGPNLISANVALGASQSWTVASGTSLAVSGDVSGTGFALTLPGAGTVTLAGNNGYTGGTNLNAGKLVINSATAIGTGALTVINAAIDNTTASPITLSTNNTQTWANNGALAFTGTQSLNLGNGAVTFGDAAAANFTISNAAAPATSVLTVGGAITGGTGGAAGVKTLTVAGTGDIVLSGNITKGATATALDLTVTNTGTVSLAGTSTVRTLNANGGPTSVIDLGNGVLTLSNGGAQTINSTGGTINASGSGSIVLSSTTAAPGDNGVATGATLTINAKLTGTTTDFEYYSASQLGTFVLTNANNDFANLQFNANGAVSVPSLGNTGSNGPAGKGAISFGGGGKLIYTGTGETSNKSINQSGTTQGATLDQSGPSGILKLTTFGTPGAGSKTLTLQGSTAGTGEISAAIVNNSGTNTTAVTKQGTGLWNLSGANLYTGATTVSGGILRLSGTSGATPITVNSGGTVQIGAAAAVSSINNVTLAGTGILDLFGNSATIGSLISTATNTITNSSLNTTASMATAPGTPSGAGVYVDALTVTPATAAVVSALITDGATRKTQIVLNNANANTQVTGNTANTYSGGLVLAHDATGTRLSPGTITGTPWGTGPIIIGQAASDKAGIYMAVANQTLANPIVFNTIAGNDVVGAVRNDVAGTILSGTQTAGLSAISYASHSGTSALTVTGKLTGTGTFTGTITNTGGSLGFGTVIGTSAGLVVGASNVNTITVTLNNSSANNDYTGDTYVTGKGVLTLGASNQIPNGATFGNVVVATGGKFNLNSFSETINGLSGAGTVDGTSGTPILTLGDNNATGLSFSGAITNTAGNLAVTKIGTGTQSLSGASSYTGPTTLSGGTLSIAAIANGGANSSIGASSNAATNLIFNGGGLKYTGPTASTDRSFTINAAKTAVIDIDATLTNLTVSGTSGATTGGLTKAGPGTLTVTGTHSYSGMTTVSQGAFALGSAADIPNSTVVNIASGATLDSSAKSIWDISGKTVTVNGELDATAITGTNTTLNGAGIINGSTTLTGGFVSPGNSPGLLTSNGNFTTVGSTFVMDIDGTTPATGYDQLSVIGVIDIGTTSVLSLNFGTMPSVGDTYFLILNDGSDSFNGTFAGIAENTPFTSGGYVFTAHYGADSSSGNLTGGNDFALYTVVPETSSMLLVMLSAGTLIFRRRR